MTQDDVQSIVPLHPISAEILIILGDQQPRYPYIIGKELKTNLGKKITVPSLYRFINELENQGLIQEVSAPSADGQSKSRGPKPRRYFALTEKAKLVMAAQANYHQDHARRIQSKLAYAPPKPLPDGG